VTIKNISHFHYAGIDSRDMGVINVSLDSGLYEDSFGASRTIIEEKTPFRDEPYFFGFNNEPRQFQLSFYFVDGWDEFKIRQVVRWLKQDYYQPLYFWDAVPERIYNCLVVDEPKIIHNGLQQGFLTLTFRCDSPYSYSHFYEETYEIGDTPFEWDIYNSGDVTITPNIEFKKIGNGDFSIMNYRNGGKEVKVSNLLDQEIIKINGDRCTIETSLVNQYRYNDFNNQSLELVYGKNTLKFTGKGTINLLIRYKFLM
jgi:phage-related protein